MLTQLEKQTVLRGLYAAKKVLDDLRPIIDALNVVYDSVGGAKTTITQQNLDLEPAFSSLTKQQLDDGMFVLTSTLRTAIANGFTQLAQLSARLNP